MTRWHRDRITCGSASWGIDRGVQQPCLSIPIKSVSPALSQELAFLRCTLFLFKWAGGTVTIICVAASLTLAMEDYILYKELVSTRLVNWDN